MSNLLSPQFWLNQRPDILTAGSRNAVIAVISAFFLLAAASLILKLRKSFYRRLYEKFFHFFISNFLIGAMLFFFSQEMIPLLSSRFWYILWALIMGAWLTFIVKYAKTLPEKKKELEKEKNYKKYLP
jgi:amino acid transporter